MGAVAHAVGTIVLIERSATVDTVLKSIDKDAEEVVISKICLAVDGKLRLCSW